MIIETNPNARTGYKRIRTPKSERNMGLASISISLDELEDVLTLIANKQWPNGSFGDDECVAWSLVRQKLGIDYR